MPLGAAGEIGRSWLGGEGLRWGARGDVWQAAPKTPTTQQRKTPQRAPGRFLWGTMGVAYLTPTGAKTSIIWRPCI